MIIRDSLQNDRVLRRAAESEIDEDFEMFSCSFIPTNKILMYRLAEPVIYQKRLLSKQSAAIYGVVNGFEKYLNSLEIVINLPGGNNFKIKNSESSANYFTPAHYSIDEVSSRQKSMNGVDNNITFYLNFVICEKHSNDEQYELFKKLCSKYFNESTTNSYKKFGVELINNLADQIKEDILKERSPA